MTVKGRFVIINSHQERPHWKADTEAKTLGAEESQKIIKGRASQQEPPELRPWGWGPTLCKDEQAFRVLLHLL